MSGGIEWLNALPSGDVETELLKCCGSANWARRMAARRPFGDGNELIDLADRVWWELGREDWLEAFSHHPKIGEKTAAKPGQLQSRRWSKEEQSGARGVAQEVQAALAEANRVYLERFGYIFIVCATGKTSEEMLALLRRRLQNDPRVELRIAAEEQRRITRLRLEKLLRIGAE